MTTYDEIEMFCRNPDLFFTQDEWISNSTKRERVKIYDFDNTCFLYAERSRKGRDYIWLTSSYRGKASDKSENMYNEYGRSTHVEKSGLLESVMRFLNDSGAINKIENRMDNYDEAEFSEALDAFFCL